MPYMRFALLLCLFLLPLTACGKKPSFVDAPEVDARGNQLSYDDIRGPDGKPDTQDKKDGIKPIKRHDDFPHVYPEPWL